MLRKSQHAFTGIHSNPQMYVGIGALTPVVKQTANIVFVQQNMVFP